MSTDKIAFIGHLAEGKDLFDGQTVKTRALFSALQNNLPAGIKLYTADTALLSEKPVSFAASFLSCNIHCRKIVVIVSKKGRKYLFPLLSLSARLFRREIFHSAIGGRLANEAKNPRVRRIISSFQRNWVESSRVASELKELGVENAEYMPNFRTGKRENCPDPPCFSSPYPLCVFSRVMEEKGIEDAVNAVEDVNRSLGYTAVNLDLYGPVEAGYEQRFSALMEQSGPEIRYCGIVKQEDTASVLSQYFALLFPTHYFNEGIPGTIIDAFFSGVPVIARKWSSCDEMLTDGLTGFCYDFDKPELLASCILKLISNPALAEKMRDECYRRSVGYDEKNVVGSFIRELSL